LLYCAEGLTSFSATWLSIGIVFLTAKLFDWGTRENLLLAAVQGAVYVGGSLASAWVAQRLGRRKLLIGVYLVMAVLCIAMAMTSSPAAFVVILMLWTIACALNWPALEAALCHGRNAHEVSRRTGHYNITWAITAAAALASVSAVTAASAMGLLITCAVLHGAGALCAIFYKETDEPHASIEAPPDLLARRELARRLSRLALPASYTVICSLTAILKGLPAIAALPEVQQSLFISLWLLVRCFVFAVLSWTSFWHARPGLLLGAVMVMAVSFAAVVVHPGFLSGTGALVWLLTWQVFLGTAIGMIYFGSLYFGMVLAHGGDESGGATEQGGFHEALIGAGSVLGPGIGALAMLAGFPASAGVITVAAGSTLACVVSAYRARLARLSAEGVR
jgi:MFS family permease